MIATYWESKPLNMNALHFSELFSNFSPIVVCPHQKTYCIKIPGSLLKRKAFILEIEILNRWSPLWRSTLLTMKQRWDNQRIRRGVHGSGQPKPEPCPAQFGLGLGVNFQYSDYLFWPALTNGPAWIQWQRGQARPCLAEKLFTSRNIIWESNPWLLKWKITTKPTRASFHC